MATIIKFQPCWSVATNRGLALVIQFSRTAFQMDQKISSRTKPRMSSVMQLLPRTVDGSRFGAAATGGSRAYSHCLQTMHKKSNNRGQAMN